MSTMPASLVAAVRELAEGQGNLGASAGRMSAHYRQRGASRQVIGGEADAVAYALSRMPATFAAVSAVATELELRAPEFAPAEILDVGAGPGTAAWAVAEAFPGISATLVDHNRAFLDLAGRLGLASDADGVETRLGEIGALSLGRTFPLVTCAYALTELGDAALLDAADRLWAHCDGVLAIIEPGRPRDYERLMQIRARLVTGGARVLAPCPHEAPCPLAAPDWCHFSVRLARSREHVQLKGGTLGYEDEKYSYLLLSRPGIGARATARVIRRPEENKFSVTLPLCAADGLETRVVPSRDKATFKAAKKLDWGDGV